MIEAQTLKTRLAREIALTGPMTVADYVTRCLHDPVGGYYATRPALGEGGDFNHGFTYSGHPVACAAALENIRILIDERLVQQVAQDTGPYLKEKFEALMDHPLVGYADTCGFVAGLNLVRKKAESVHDCEFFDPEQGVGMLCRGYMFANGIIMRAVGDRMIIAPPLVMTRAQIDEMIFKIRYCLEATLIDVQKRGWVL